MTIRRLLARNAAPDTPEALAWRLRRNAAVEQMLREIDAQFPEITQSNFREACDWQERRIAELMADT